MTSYTPPRLPLPPTFNNIYFLETNFLTQGEASDTYLPKSFPIFSGSIRGSDGSAITPSYTFSSKPDTGIFLGSVHHINFTSLGVQRLHVADDHIRAYEPIRLSSDIPSLCFQADQNTGLSNPAVNALSLLTNNIERLLISNNGIQVSTLGTIFKNIRFGSFNHTGTLNNASGVTVPAGGVSLSGFSVTPFIFITTFPNPGNTWYPQCYYCVVNPSSTSFQVNINNLSGNQATGTVTIYWLAIGS